MKALHVARRQTVIAIVAIALAFPLVESGAQDVAFAAGLSDLDSATQVVVGKEIARARASGLPIDPLIAKVREGRLKRAPEARIRAAVERLSERLSASRDALGTSSTPAEVTAGADAIAAGAQPASLRALRAATSQPVMAPIGALAQLLASGVTERKAMEMVLGLLRRSASPAMLIALGNQVEADVGSGLSPTASAAFRLRAIESALNGLTADAAYGNFGNTAASNNNGTTSPPRRKP